MILNKYKNKSRFFSLRCSIKLDRFFRLHIVNYYWVKIGDYLPHMNMVRVMEVLVKLSIHCSFQMLRGRHVMVRVGGGWMTLESYLDKHVVTTFKRVGRSLTTESGEAVDDDFFIMKAKYKSHNQLNNNGRTWYSISGVLSQNRARPSCHGNYSYSSTSLQTEDTYMYTAIQWQKEASLNWPFVLI